MIRPATNFARRARHVVAVTVLLGAMVLPAFGAAAPARATPSSNLPAAVAPSAAGSSPRPSPNQDIRDIRPPYHIPPQWLWIAWTAGGLAALAVGFAAFHWFLRRRGRGKLPYELALEQLDAARRLMQPDRARDFSITVSEIVRGFIEKVFRIKAAHSTTDEFLRDLIVRSDSPLAAHRDTLSDFLTHCDLAKFARWSLSVLEMQTLLESARAFVLATGKPAAKKAAGPEITSAVRSVNDGPARTPTTLTSQPS
jgi:hypothetical protein